MSAIEDIMDTIRRFLGPYHFLGRPESKRAWEAMRKEIATILDGEEERIRMETEDEIGPGAR